MTTYYKELRCTDDLLRECGIDYDTAYFMEYGKHPPRVETDWKKYREYMESLNNPDNIDRTDPHWETQPDEYYCMRMWRFPNWWV